MPKSPLTQPSWRDRGTCWATTKAGLPCGKRACSKPESSGIPYCARHMRVGDEAFQVVEHDEQLAALAVGLRDAAELDDRLAHLPDGSR